VNERIFIEVIDGGHQAVLEFLFGRDADVAQDRSGELGKEALDEVEPRAVLWREGEFESPDRLLGKPSFCLARDVGRMIVENQMDRRMGGVSRIENLEKFDELAAAVTVPDQGVHLAGQQIDARQQAHRALGRDAWT